MSFNGRNSEKQRKAFFARMNSSSRSSSSSVNTPQRKTGMARKVSRFKDSDKDGVPDHKDCKPFDPKKQGVLHDIQVRLLRKREELLERKREKEERKLEDLRDRLKEKRSVVDKRAAVKSLKIEQKQAIIDEMVREKQVTKELKEANIKAKQELEKGTIQGFIKKSAKGAIKAASSEKTKRVIRNSTLALARSAGFLTKKKVKQIKKRFKE